ncbi:hypothetical protein PsAD2_01589 [Pseudovibrio axinellae]|uniref:HIG1 domain-containing protein n=1 Tax=Pseudovibrio axinellae TaxID=989403 RepID=A0A165ZNU7_9HYPH|nr:hypothetical protein PsAD2_01589 [Pseudovibrio axinellae]SEQ25270.1 hypothetical protein SAMN05421798_102248 [Pseudovibrio axinellae]
MLTAVLLIVFAVAFFCVTMSGVFWINACASKTKGDFLLNLRKSLRFLSYFILLGLSFLAFGMVFGEPSESIHEILSQISILN